MFLAEKSPRRYVVLYQEFLYKIFIITETYPPEYYYHTSPDVTTVVSGTRSTLFYALQEVSPVCSGPCAFTKRPDDAEIVQFMCDTSSPDDMPWPFIKTLFIPFREFSLGDLPLCQEVLCRPGGGSR